MEIFGFKRVRYSFPTMKLDNWVNLTFLSFLSPNHTHAPLARAMYAALKQSRTNDKFQDPLFLFLELIRAGVLHWNLWGGRAYSGGPSFGDDDEKKCMLLVMRVVSLVPLNTKVSDCVCL
jgi:hypothetical protein